MTARSDTAEVRTVAEAFDEAVRTYGGHDFLQVLAETAAVLGGDAGTWSYGSADVAVRRLRARYAAAGYGPGHRAGLLLLNTPDFLLHFLALNGLGVSIVPINPDWRAAELEYLIGHSEIALAVHLVGRGDALAAAAAAAGRRLVLAGPDLVDLGTAPVPAPRAGQRPDERSECALLYTSGTTGQPKGCVLSNEYFLHCGRWYTSVGGLCTVRPGAERMLTPLPLTHMNALAVSTMCMIMGGGCLILLDRFHPSTWWQSVRASAATIVHYLGVMPALLLAAPPAADDRRHCVRFGFGAGVNPRHHAAFEHRFGFPLVEAWAMTETGSGAVVVANEEPRHVGTACFGVAAPEVECRVVGEDGRSAAAGLPGELLVRHAGRNPRYGFFDGYLKDEAATAQAWQDGWFHTGDLVTRDADGRFRFVDRKKNVIRRSGENISAVEVESVLAQHPMIRNVGVTAVPDPLRGDEVYALVVLHSADFAGPEVAAQIVAFCRERLAYFKAPGYVAFCDALPLTATEKLQRSKLKELAVLLQERGAGHDLRSMKRRDEG